MNFIKKNIKKILKKKNRKYLIAAAIAIAAIAFYFLYKKKENFDDDNKKHMDFIKAIYARRFKEIRDMEEGPKKEKARKKWMKSMEKSKKIEQKLENKVAKFCKSLDEKMQKAFGGSDQTARQRDKMRDSSIHLAMNYPKFQHFAGLCAPPRQPQHTNQEAAQGTGSGIAPDSGEVRTLDAPGSSGIGMNRSDIAKAQQAARAAPAPPQKQKYGSGRYITKAQQAARAAPAPPQKQKYGSGRY